MTATADPYPLKTHNELAFAREFEGRCEVISASPAQIDFETSSRCNIRCYTCPKTYTKDNGEDASRELFDRMAEATFARARSINLTGFGEPMISPHFEYFYEQCIQAGLQVGFVTNGSLLTEEWLERFSPSPVHLFLSVDAAEAAIMKIMRPHLNFDKLSHILSRYAKLHDATGDTHRCQLYMQFVPTLQNIEQLPKVIEWAVESRAKRVEVLNFRPQDLPPEVAAQHIANDLTRTSRAFALARQRSHELRIPLVLPQGFEGEMMAETAGEVATSLAPVQINKSGSKYPLACSAPWFRVSIHQNGDVRPCCWYPYAMGNLWRQAFEEIWNGPNYQKMRRRINTRFPQLGCKTCPMVWGITAGNPDSIFKKEGLIDRAHTWLQQTRRRFPR